MARVESGQTYASRKGKARKGWAAGLMLLASGWITGCGEPTATFSLNSVYLRKQEIDQQNEASLPQAQVTTVVNAVTALFGTPDEPYMPPGVEGISDVLDMKRIKTAAGRVNSDQYGTGEGLYRQHCVHCHGITGNGRGPTATFLNPYPRDFTKGTFKFDSTPIGVKPTDDDLRHILMEGIPGTAMPSFALLDEGEITALVDYVKYLSIRGEVERRLIEQMAGDYDPEDPAAYEAIEKEFLGREFLVDEVLTEVVASWNSAKESVTEVPERATKYDRYSPEFDAAELKASEERGRKLYYTTTANCFSCHGPSQLGDGQVNDYDNWSKEFFDWTKKSDEAYSTRLAEFESHGGLPPRNIIPRNLREGIYRGGRRPIDIFWRVHNGIDGTPMPAANKVALSNEDIWDIVNYVLSLPYEPVSRPGLENLTNERGVR